MPSFPIQVVDKNKGLTIPPRVEMKNCLSGGEGRFAVFCIPQTANIIILYNNEKGSMPLCYNSATQEKCCKEMLTISINVVNNANGIKCNSTTF